MWFTLIELTFSVIIYLKWMENEGKYLSEKKDQKKHDVMKKRKWVIRNFFIDEVAMIKLLNRNEKLKGHVDQNQFFIK